MRHDAATSAGRICRPSSRTFTHDSLGWLTHLPAARTFGALGILIAFGHSILAMSGEESLAQVNREIEAPKLKNLLRTGFIIFIYSLLLTGLISFFAVMIIPDSVRMAKYGDDLIGGLAMYMVGPLWARIALRVFVVFVGFLILAGAVNTAIVGSVGVLTRVAEDGVMLDWFRLPHKRFGTNYRIVNLVAGLQIATIILSRGDMYILGEAYAFGVVWSFVFKSLSVLVLRYRQKYHRLVADAAQPHLLSARRPGFPARLGAHVSGAARHRADQPAHQASRDRMGSLFHRDPVRALQHLGADQRRGRARVRRGAREVQLETIEDGQPLDFDHCGNGHAETGHATRKLIAIRDPGNLAHLHRYLSEPDDAELIALTVRNERGLASSEGAQPFTSDEEKLFSKVVKVCEDHGRAVRPMVVVSNDQQFAIANTAFRLGVDEIVMGVSAKFSADAQLENFAMHWGALGADERHVKVRVLSDDRDIRAEI